MISPGERFDAFSSNRLIKRQDNTSIFGNNSKFALSPNKHSLFIFIHQLNRSITNIPWIFWVPTIITFIQFEVSVMAPLNYHHWETIPQMVKAIKVLEIILRYVPQSAPQMVTNILFAIYSILVVAHFILLVSIVSLIRHKKDTNVLIKIFFFYSYLILPFLRSSVICVVSEEVTQIVRNPNFGSFFLSLFALIILLVHLFMTAFIQFSMGSSPSPNLINPLAIWGPCAWRSVLFEIYECLLFMFLEFTRSIKNQTVFAILIIIVLLVSIPHAVYQSMRTYYISYSAYEYIGGLLWTMIVYGIMHIIQCFCPDLIPFWVFIFIWLILPIIGFIVMKIVTEYRLKKVRKALDVCAATAVPFDSNRKGDQEEYTTVEIPLNSYVFDDLNVKRTGQAIFVARAACLSSHSTFIDLSLIRYFIERFPDGLFYFLHLVFLGHGPNQNQFQYVEKLISIYLDTQLKKVGILQLCVFFQIITSIQESSNDIPQSLVRELGKQRLQEMKCQQLLSKFWASGCKGDITQMSRHVFALNKHVSELNGSWKLLVMRYPYSMPVVNAYVEFLLATGTQHRLAEIIISNRPQVSEASSSSSSDPDMNISILHQAIEDAVDRRPIISINKLKASLAISILIAIIFFLVAIIISFIFIDKYSNYNEFVKESIDFETIFSCIPNYFDDIYFMTNSTFVDYNTSSADDIIMIPESSPEYEARVFLLKKTEELANSLNSLLRKMPTEILKESFDTVHNIYLSFDLYNNTKDSSFINTLRLTSYFSQCMPFIPVNDPCVSLVMKNLAVTISMIEEKTMNSILEIQKIVDFYVKYSPVFYVLSWALLFIVMTPLVYFSIKALKDEITYLLSIYLTIPRSVLTKFAENRTGGSIGSRMQQDVTNNSLTMPHSFNLQATGIDNNGAPLVVQDQDANKNEVNNNNDSNVADTFKLLVYDHSNVNYSVLPKFFVVKALFIFGFISVLITILSTITCALFVKFSKSFVSCLYTQRITSERTVGSSVVMHGITSFCEDISPQEMLAIINSTGKFHTAILFKDSSFNLSTSALGQKEVIELQSSERCGDKSNNSCLSLVSLFDIFTTQVISISNNFLLQKQNKTTTITKDQSNDTYQNLRRIFNDELFPLLYKTQKLVYDFTHNEIHKFHIGVIIIIIVGCIVSFLVFMLFMLPMIREINDTIESVKLPLKHISPLDIVDFEKILMYLQGECDFKRGGNNEKNNETGNGNSLLNAMLSPFAIFEDDLSLLFANNAFYSLLGTSREASIGLPLADIFSIVLPFRNDESHPFNTLLNSISRMQQGELLTDKDIEIKTELEFQDIKTCPVMIKLVAISNEKQNENDKSFHLDHTSKGNLKSFSYVLFVNDLSVKKELEEKIKFEEETSQRLINSSIPKNLSTLIQKGSNSFEPRRFENIPIAMFSIKFTKPEEELEDEMAFAYNLFVKTASDINHNFSRSVIKLVHDPPNWFFISDIGQTPESVDSAPPPPPTATTNDNNNNNNNSSGGDGGGDVVDDLIQLNDDDGVDVPEGNRNNLIIELTDLLHFAISVVDVFIASSNKDCSLKVVVHTGQLFIIPLALDLPMVEALGSGYRKLRSMNLASKSASVFCTSEVEKILRKKNLFKFSQALEGGGDPLFSVKIDNEHAYSQDE